MKNMSRFQIVALIIFGLLTVGGVLVFALGNISGSDKSVNVTVWGTIPRSAFSEALSAAGLDQNSDITVRYSRKDPERYEQQLVEALASGGGPDIFFLTHDAIIEHHNKVRIISYESYPRRKFENSFISAGNVFILDQGIIAFPFVVDPLVMYWNERIFANASLSQPPQYWDEYFDMIPKLTVKDRNLNISQSALAMGEYRNVSNAKAVLSTLFMQTGNPIVRFSGRAPRSVLTQDKEGSGKLIAHTVLNFYTQFANPTNAAYSWNRSLPSSRRYFAAGNLATYFGYASELETIRRMNPNLNFDVAPMPQSRKNNQKTTYARLAGLAISRTSQDPRGALQVIQQLVQPQSIQGVSQALQLPPVRRDLLTGNPSDPYQSVFQTSAIWSQTWLEPDSAEVSTIFQEMVEAVTSGRSTISGAVQRASKKLDRLIQSVRQ